MDKKKNIAL